LPIGFNAMAESYHTPGDGQPAFILAGSYEQYRRYLSERNLSPDQFRYFSRPGMTRGRTGCRMIRIGTWYLHSPGFAYAFERAAISMGSPIEDDEVIPGENERRAEALRVREKTTRTEPGTRLLGEGAMAALLNEAFLVSKK
jgi:hypothetical protein